MEKLATKVELPDDLDLKPYAVWVYEEFGEPAFELKFSCDNAAETLTLEVTPMHMSGEPGEKVTVVAN